MIPDDVSVTPERAPVGIPDDTLEGTAVTAHAVELAALAAPGVVALHGGAYGEVATYLPGRRVTGVRLGAERTEVHVVVALGSQVVDTALGVRRAVQPLVGTPVDVFVQDLA